MEIRFEVTKPELIIIFLGITLALVTSIQQYLLFCKTYFSPSQTILFSINTFGEANLEMVVVSVSMVLIIASSTYLFKVIFPKLVKP
jgi:hypothetical protein